MSANGYAKDVLVTTEWVAEHLGDAKVVVAEVDEKRLDTPHTLNGTAVTDRWALAILENFRGDVPDVLREFGAPARVEN